MRTTPELVRISPDPLNQRAAPDPDSARQAPEPPKHHDTSVAQALGDRGRAWRLVRKRRSRFPPNGV